MMHSILREENPEGRIYYTDIDLDGHKISRFGGLPRELYFPKELIFCPEGKYNYLGTTDT